MNTLIALNIIAVSMIVNIAIAVYGIVKKPSMVKKIISLGILSDTVCLLAVYMGFTATSPHPPLYAPGYGAGRGVDPVVQAFVLTAIVIALAFTVFLATITLRMYEVANSTDLHELLKLEIASEEIEQLEE